jgi:catechol 2,3-dioxygenase-like lactoylglutathione lyase family enzyme
MTDHSPILRLEALVVSVRDVSQAEQSYSRILGRAAFPADGAAPTSVSFRLENTGLRLAPGARESVAGLVFAVGDLALAARRLEARGIAFEEWGGAGGPALAIRPATTRGLALFLGEGAAEPPLPSPLRADVERSEEAVSGLDHVVVRTADAEDCRLLFGELLGLRLALDQTRPEWGVRQLFFRVRGVTVEVVQPIDPAKRPASDHYWGLAWKTPDLAALRERLAREGLDVSEVRPGRKPGTRVATLRSATHGIPTLLIEHSRP